MSKKINSIWLSQKIELNLLLYTCSHFVSISCTDGAVIGACRNPDEGHLSSVAVPAWILWKLILGVFFDRFFRRCVHKAPNIIGLSNVPIIFDISNCTRNVSGELNFPDNVEGFRFIRNENIGKELTLRWRGLYFTKKLHSIPFYIKIFYLFCYFIIQNCQELL